MNFHKNIDMSHGNLSIIQHFFHINIEECEFDTMEY